MLLESGRYFGRRMREREESGLLLSEHRHRAQERIPLHRHEHAYLCLVVEGAFVERSGATIRECARSHVVYHPAGEVHADRFGTAGGRCLNVEISSEWPLLASDDSIPDEPVLLSNPKVADIGRRLYFEFAEPDDSSALSVHGLVALLLAEANRPPKRAERLPAWLETVMDLLRTRYAEPLTLAEIASEAGVHPTHLARAFHRYVGETIHESIRRLRVERACELLTRTDLPVGQIAHAVGFCDHSHLTRTFHRVLGMPPSQYRLTRR